MVCKLQTLLCVGPWFDVDTLQDTCDVTVMRKPGAKAVMLPVCQIRDAAGFHIPLTTTRDKFFHKGFSLSPTQSGQGQKAALLGRTPCRYLTNLTKPQELIAPQSGQCCTNCHELDNA